jgi:hypothetical protein
MQPPNQEFFTRFREGGPNIVESVAIPLTCAAQLATYTSDNAARRT